LCLYEYFTVKKYVWCWRQNVSRNCVLARIYEKMRQWAFKWHSLSFRLTPLLIFLVLFYLVLFPSPPPISLLRDRELTRKFCIFMVKSVILFTFSSVSKSCIYNIQNMCEIFTFSTLFYNFLKSFYQSFYQSLLILYNLLFTLKLFDTPLVHSPDLNSYRVLFYSFCNS